MPAVSSAPVGPRSSRVAPGLDTKPSFGDKDYRKVVKKVVKSLLGLTPPLNEIPCMKSLLKFPTSTAVCKNRIMTLATDLSIEFSDWSKPC